jgi:hypothetical protein
MPLEAVHRPAPDVSLQDEAREVALDTCWRDRAAVLVFLRHFG